MLVADKSHAIVVGRSKTRCVFKLADVADWHQHYKETRGIDVGAGRVCLAVGHDRQIE